MSNEWEVMEELGCNLVQWGSPKNKQYPRWNIVIPPSELKEDQVPPTQIANDVIQSDQYHRKYFLWRLSIFNCKVGDKTLRALWSEMSVTKLKTVSMCWLFQFSDFRLL